MDELRIYNTSLNATQIAALANASPTVASAAASTPGSVTGTSTALTALGASNIIAEPVLTYSWAATSVPSGASAPAFSANGTNAAKNCTATFSQAGSYTLTATIADTGGGTVTGSVNVTVSQTLTGVTVAAGTPAVGSQITQQFTATARDQFGDALAAQPAFTWTSGGYGGVNSAGLFTAPYASGTASVMASTGGFSSASAGVTASTPWKTWVTNVFTPAQANNPVISGPNANPDGDGLNNLLEYAFNGSPFAGTMSILPVVAVSGGTMTLTFRQNDAATDLTYTVEQSPDAVTWTTATPNTTILSDDGATRVISAALPIGSAKKLLLRLRVTMP